MKKAVTNQLFEKDLTIVDKAPGSDYGQNDEKRFSPTDASYNPTSGDLVLTIAAHGLSQGDTINIAENGLTFTCGMDGNTATKTYPRTTDPVYNTAIAVTAVTATAITVDVGQSSGFVISDVDYNPTTGDMEMTIGTHALTTSNTVTIAPDVLAFTCDADNHQTIHTYPRTTDPSYNTAIAITGVTATSITVMLVLHLVVRLRHILVQLVQIMHIRKILKYYHLQEILLQ